MIPFNKPPFAGKEFDYMQQAQQNNKICGDGEFTKKCSRWLEQNVNTKKVDALSAYNV